LSISLTRASLLYLRAIIERRGRSIFSIARLRDRPTKQLEKPGMAALDFARRNRSGVDRFASARQRSSVFQPLQFLPPQNALAIGVSASADPYAWFWPLAAVRLCSSTCTFLSMRRAVISWNVFRVWPRALRQPPFVVSLILQA